MLATLTAAALLSGFAAPAKAVETVPPAPPTGVGTEAWTLDDYYTPAKKAEIDAKIAEVRARNPYLRGRVGTPKYGLSNWGVMQNYMGGSIVSYSLGTWALRTPIRDAYLRAGGPQNMGYPQGPESGPLKDGVSRQSFFKNGTIYSHPVYGAHVVNVYSFDRYGGLDGRLGYPKSDPVKVDPTKANSTLRQKFRGGSVYKSATGHEWVVFNK